jgi:2Fe-2S ferredoxin
MTTINFTGTDGSEYRVDAAIDHSLMMAAVNHDVPGIDAECGGDMACGTCHVYVDEKWVERIPAAGDEEAEMLDVLVEKREPNSRLSCQMKVAGTFDGLHVTVAEP